MSELDFDHELASRLPTPLAELYYDAHNESDSFKRHQSAFYLFEVAIKLLGSAAIVAYAEHPTHDPKLVEQLKKLVRPTLGDWWGFVKILVPRLAAPEDEGFQLVERRLLKSVSLDTPRAAGLFVQLQNRFPKKAVVKQEDSDDSSAGSKGSGSGRRVGARTTVRLRDLFDLLVRYRNKEMGHGALGKHTAEFYDSWGKSILSGLSDILMSTDFLAGRKLLYVAGVNQGSSGNWVVDRYLLSGLNPQLSRQSIPDSQRDKLLMRGRTYLETGPSAAYPDGQVTCLHPLLIYDMQSKQTLLMDVREGNSRTGYLSYRNSEHVERPDLGDEQRDLLARVLGIQVASPGTADEADATDGSPNAPQATSDHVPADGSAPLAPPTELIESIGDYQLLSILGEGGMGRVYRGWDPSLQKTVAIKCLLRPGNARHQARFAREIRAMGRIKHPNLAEILASGAEGDQYFFAMELVEGASLQTLCETLDSSAKSATEVDKPTWEATVQAACQQTRGREQPLSQIESLEIGAVPIPSDTIQHVTPLKDGSYVRQMVELIRQIAEAADAVHAAGLVHRDIKPGNIIVDPTGSRAVLVDLGIAQVTEDGGGQLTETREIVGTLLYASPEQVLAIDKLDRRSDIYSLGATLWELLTLHHLYGAEKNTPRVELARRIQYSEPERLRKYLPRVSRDLDAIVAKCLEKNPKQRYQTARELADDLRRFLANEPVTARPVSDLVRFARLCRRNPLISTMAFATIAVALVGFGISTAMWWRARSLWYEAEEARRAAEQSRNVAIESQHEAEVETERTRAALAEADVQKQRAEGALSESNRQRDLANNFASEARKALRRAELGEQAAGRNLYAAQVRLAQVMLKEGEIRSAADALGLYDDPRGDGSIPIPGGQPPGWEWYYLAELCRSQINVIKSPRAPIQLVVFHPNGESYFTGDEEGNLMQWSTRTGTVLRTFPAAGQDEVGLGFSLRWQDRKISVVSRIPGEKPDNADASVPQPGDEIVYLYDRQGKRIHVSELDEAAARSLVAGESGTQLEMDFRTPRQGPTKHFVAKRQNYRSLGHTGGITSIVVSPDGEILASAGEDRTIRIWGLDGYLLTTAVGGGGPLPSPITSLAIGPAGPDGERLAMSVDTHIAIAPLRRPLGRVDVAWAGKDKHTATINRLQFVPGTPLLVSASDDGTVKVWDYEKLALRQTVAVNSQENVSDRGVMRIAAAPDGKRVAGVSRSGRIFCWDVTDAGQLQQSFTSKQRIFFHAAFRPNSRTLAASAYDGTVRILARDGREMSRLPMNSGPVMDVAFSPDGQFLASANRDRTATLRRMEVREQDQMTIKHGASRLEFAADGNRVVVGNGKSVSVWDGASGRLIKKWDDVIDSFGLVAGGDALVTGQAEKVIGITPHDDARVELCSVPAGNVGVVAACKNGSLIAAANDDADNPRIVIYDTQMQKVIKQLQPPEGRMTWMTFSKDGRWLAHRLGSQRAAVWKWQSDEPPFILEIAKASLTAAFHPTTHSLAIGMIDGSVELWAIEYEGADMPHRERQLRGHRSFVTGIDFTADGQRMVTSGSDGTIRVWDTENRQEFISLRYSGDDPAMSIALGGPGKQWRLVSGGDNSIRFWDAAAISPQASSDVPAWSVVQGCVRSDLGRWEEAVDDFSSAIQRGSKDPYIWQLRGMANYHLRRLKAAQADFDHASELLPTDPSIWTSRSLVEMERGDTAAAEISYARAVECVGPPISLPGNQWIGRVKYEDAQAALFGWDRLIADLTRMSEQPEAPWYVHRARGLAKADLAFYTEACKCFEDATRLNPQDWQSWRGLGRAHMTRNMKPGETAKDTYRQGAEALSRAIALHPDAWDLWYERAICHRFVDDYALAVADLNEAAKRNERAWVIPAERGTARISLKQYSEAADDFVKAKLICGWDDEVATRGAYTLLAAKNTAGYAKLCEEIVRQHADTQDASLANSVSWAVTIGPGGMKNYDQAIQLIERAVAQFPKDVTYLGTLGTVLYRAGQYERAIEASTQAINLHPGGGNVFDILYLALAHQKHGQAQNAQDAWKRAKVLMDAYANKTAPDQNNWTPILQLQLDLVRAEAERELGIATK